MKRNYNFPTTQKNAIQVTTYFQKENFNGNSIIYVHGFKGFKDWGFVPYTAEYFSNLGYLVITFNFSHNGIGKNPLELTEIEAFSKNTISLEVDELMQIINATKENYFFSDFVIEKIGLIGHSRGGGVSIIAASNNKNVDALATWSSISIFDRFSERQKSEWKERGFVEVKNMRTNQIYRMNYSYLKDILTHKDNKLSLKLAASNLKTSWLIVHGENDLAVEIDEAKKLFEWSDKDKTKLSIIPNTGHTFDEQHPFIGPAKTFKGVLEITKKFFYQNL